MKYLPSLVDVPLSYPWPLQ